MTQKQLKEWIDKMGGRQAAADYLDVDQATVWRWLKNPRQIKKMALIAIQANQGLNR